MIKFRWYYDKDKEEKWLNDMASKGLALKKFFLGFYSFEKTEKNKWTYKIDLMDDIVSSKSSIDYIKFVEETGAEFVCSWFRWIFFRKETSKGKFELYTDADSKIEHYKKIKNMFLTFGMLELLILPSQFNLIIHEIWIGYISFPIIVCFEIIVLSIAIKTNLKIKELMKNAGNENSKK